MKFIDKKLLKFLLVGIINTLVGSVVMFLLYNIAHFGYWVSSIFNYIVGGVLSFFLNKYFTFSNHEKSIKQILLYCLNLIACYVIAYLLAKRLMYYLLSSQPDNIRDNFSMAIGMLLYTVLNYFGQRLLVFVNNKDKKDGADE